MLVNIKYEEDNVVEMTYVIEKDIDTCMAMFYRVHPQGKVLDYEYYTI